MNPQVCGQKIIDSSLFTLRKIICGNAKQDRIRQNPTKTVVTCGNLFLSRVFFGVANIKFCIPISSHLHWKPTSTLQKSIVTCWKIPQCSTPLCDSGCFFFRDFPFVDYEIIPNMLAGFLIPELIIDQQV